MFNIGFSEMVLIAIIALIALGPEQLPGVAKMFGKLVGEVKKVKDEFTKQIHESSRDTVVTFRNAGKAISDPINEAVDSVKKPHSLNNPSEDLNAKKFDANTAVANENEPVTSCLSPSADVSDEDTKA